MPKLGGFRNFMCKMEGKDVLPLFQTFDFSNIHIMRTSDFADEIGRWAGPDPVLSNRGIRRSFNWSSISEEFSDLMNENLTTCHQLKEVEELFDRMLQHLRDGGTISGMDIHEWQDYTPYVLAGTVRPQRASPFSFAQMPEPMHRLDEDGEDYPRAWEEAVSEADEVELNEASSS